VSVNTRAPSLRYAVTDSVAQGCTHSRVSDGYVHGPKGTVFDCKIITRKSANPTVTCATAPPPYPTAVTGGVVVASESVMSNWGGGDVLLL
jgi:hypothetical protein